MQLDYQKLQQAYQALQLENEQLKQENFALKEQLQALLPAEQTSPSVLVDIEKVPIAVPADVAEIPCEMQEDANTITRSLKLQLQPVPFQCNQHSKPQEKIELFCSLFHGREDVYAKRWYAIKSKKSGYQPVCANEWEPYLCDKRKFKCKDCPNRRLLPLDHGVIEHHLRGKDEFARDVVGIYPMLEDETCFFLAVDFDEGNYQQEVQAFRKTCEMHGIPALVERSRSGDGAHVWFLFSEKVEVPLARKLGSGLLTAAMAQSNCVKFSSYDRLFPNQDTMPSGGFGNLIALPLQGVARRNGNSVFVDEHFAPYPDQWAYLSDAKLLTRADVEQLVKVLCKHGDVGVLSQEESSEKPWEKRSKKNELAPMVYREIALQTVQSNRLYIPKQGLPTPLCNAIRRLGAFKNPEFYKAQAMRLPIYDKPRILSVVEETEEYIGLPRGAKESLEALLAHCGCQYHFVPEYNCGAPVEVEFEGALREEQKIAAQALLVHDTGVLSATTAFGKTVIAANIIATHKVNTLVLVHTQALMNQWVKSLSMFLNFSDELQQQVLQNVNENATKRRKKTVGVIGVLGGGKDSLHGVVDIAIMQSLVHEGEVKELVRNYGQIIVDECHHVSAVNFEKILNFATAKYVYGLTATPTRQDGQQAIVFLSCGAIRHKVDALSQAKQRGFDHVLIPRFTAFRKSALQDERNVTKILGVLAEDESRNTLLVADIKAAILAGRTPIILTERAAHVIILEELLHTLDAEVICLTGAASAKEKRLVAEKLSAVPAEQALVLIATGKYVGEGFDFPRLDTLFLAMPISWSGKVAQYAGRLHRDYQGKNEVQIYDYIDVHIPVLDKMYHKRLKAYASIGYSVREQAVLPSSEKVVNCIYDGKSFFEPFTEAISNAKKEVVIVSPSIHKTRLAQLVRALAPALLRDVVVTVYTKLPSGSINDEQQEKALQNIAYLKDYRIKVVEKEVLYQKFAIIDQNAIWYGNINFFSFAKEQDSVMCLESKEIAQALFDVL